MDGLGDSLLHGPPEPDDHPGGSIRRAQSGAVFPRPGDSDYVEAMFHLMEALTSVGSVYEVAVPEEGDAIVNVVAWWDDDCNETHASVVIWPCQN